MKFEVTESLKSRFFAKVSKSDGDEGCWIWTGACRGNGYGSIKIEGRVLDVHRVSFVIANGPFADGLLVCHRCDTKLCVNPAHLFVGTYSDNRRDAVAKGIVVPYRKTRSEPLSDQEIESIRNHYSRGVSRRAIASKFNVSTTSLDRVLARVGLK